MAKLASMPVENAEQLIPRLLQGACKSCNKPKDDYPERIQPINTDNRGLSEKALKEEAVDRQAICPIYYINNDINIVQTTQDNIYRDFMNIKEDMNREYIFSDASTSQKRVVSEYKYAFADTIIQTYMNMIVQCIVSYTDHIVKSTNLFSSSEINDDFVSEFVDLLYKDIHLILYRVRDVAVCYLNSESENEGYSIYGNKAEPDFLLLDYQIRISTDSILSVVANIINEVATKFVYCKCFVRDDESGSVKSLAIQAVTNVFRSAINEMYPMVYANLCNVRGSFIEADIQRFPKSEFNPLTGLECF